MIKTIKIDFQLLWKLILVTVFLVFTVCQAPCQTLYCQGPLPIIIIFIFFYEYAYVYVLLKD